MPGFASTLRALAGALPLAALAACSAITGDGDGLPVDFAITSTNPAAPREFAAASTAPGTISISGFVGYGGCDAPRASARLEGQAVVVRVELKTNTRATCPDILIVSSYRADVKGLDPRVLPLDGLRLETDFTVQ
jgi:hypothetical protein